MPHMLSRELVSIVSPVCNEELTLSEFIERIRKTIAPLQSEYDFELLLVDDGSTDQSAAIINRELENDKRIRLIQLSRNFGQTAALQAGFDRAQGSIIISLDADLQHFPEEIPLFLREMEKGHDIVCGWRRLRRDGYIRRWPSYAANWLIRLITGLPFRDFGTTYRAYRADLVKELALLGEFHRFIPALGYSLGGRITEIPIRNIERPAGQSKCGLNRTSGVLVDLIVLLFLTRFKDRPMRAFGRLGLFCGGLGAVLLSAAAVTAVFWGTSPHSSLVVGLFVVAALLLVTAVNLFAAGVLAELFVRLYFEQNDRRVYRVQRETAAEPARKREVA